MTAAHSRPGRPLPQTIGSRNQATVGAASAAIMPRYPRPSRLKSLLHSRHPGAGRNPVQRIAGRARSYTSRVRRSPRREAQPATGEQGGVFEAGAIYRAGRVADRPVAGEHRREVPRPTGPNPKKPPASGIMARSRRALPALWSETHSCRSGLSEKQGKARLDPSGPDKPWLAGGFFGFMTASARHDAFDARHPWRAPFGRAAHVLFRCPAKWWLLLAKQKWPRREGIPFLPSYRRRPVSSQMNRGGPRRDQTPAPTSIATEVAPTSPSTQHAPRHPGAGRDPVKTIAAGTAVPTSPSPLLAQLT